MRVIAGEAKGRVLQGPRGLGVRPSAARLRESLFGILESRGAVAGRRVLDLFAGTGALGIEALSRGAASLVSIEQAPSVARMLRSNLERCGFAGRSEVLAAAVGTGLRRLGARGDRFDLVLADPPYRTGAADDALRDLVAHGLVAPGARIVVETARGESVAAPPGLGAPDDVRCYGDGQLTFFHVPAPAGRPEGSADASD